MKLERHMPDAKWERAADVVLAIWRPWIEQQHLTRFVMRPVTAPDGSTVEYLILVEAWRDATREHVSQALVVDDKLVEGGGVDAAVPYSRKLGFPKTQLDRGLLFEVLESYGLIGTEWGWLPSVHGWEILDDVDRVGRKPVVLEYTADGATLTLYRNSPEDDSQGTTARKLVDELQFYFDRDAKITRKHSRERRDGTWTQLPL